jgi:major type 1 subunit fimbrin (pilin)
LRYSKFKNPLILVISESVWVFNNPCAFASAHERKHIETLTTLNRKPMKHKLLALATAAAALTPMISSASDGTITFTGAVQAVTCAITTPNLNVTLPTVSTSALGAANATAGATRFVIAINNCTGIQTNANAYFEAGPNVDSTTGRVKNATGTATNVDLELTTAAGTKIDLSKAYGSQYTGQTGNIVSGSATLEYAVRYFATAAATAGSVISTLSYSVVYN